MRYSSDPGAHHLFEKGFQQRRHRALPKREDDDEMPCQNDRVTCWHQHRRELASLEILLRAQHWEIDLRQLDPHYSMPRCCSAICVGIGKAMA